MTLTRTEFKRPLPTKERKVRTKLCKVKSCRKEFTPAKPLQACCSVPCAIDFAQAERVRIDRKTRQEGLRKLKRRADYLKEAQIAFNAFVRARDADRLCISCDTVLASLGGSTGGAYDCGHYRSTGSAPHMRFDERNAHGQCKKCNRYLAGNAVSYRANLIARIGLLAVDAVECDQSERKWSIEELQAIKTQYKTKLKQLKGAGDA